MFAPVNSAVLPGGHGLDGRPDPVIGPAAAQVAAHNLVDVVVGGFGVLLEEEDGLHDLAGLAVAALSNVIVDPGLLDGVKLAALGDALDGGHAVSGDTAQGGDAGPPGGAVDVGRTGAAEAHTAPVLRPL